MDSITLYYFTELAKDLNMHRTAERVFVSQQTISNHIQRLEAELGCTLFERKPSLMLTYAGQQVLMFAEDVVRGRRNLQDRLADIASEEKGSICFGSSRLRLDSCFPQILPQFWKQYPQVELKLRDDIERELEDLVRKGEVDLGVIVNVEDETDLVKEHLMDDQIYVCVPDRLLREARGGDADRIRERSITGVDLRDLEGIPFCMMENKLGRDVRKCFDEAGLSPEIRLTAPYMQLTASIGFTGMAAFVSTQMGITARKAELPPDLNIFPLHLGGEPVLHTIYLIRHRKRYLPVYTRYLVELTRRYFAEIERRHIGRAAVSRS